MKIEFSAENGEKLTPLEVAKSLVAHGAFCAEELKELAEYLQVYHRFHRDKEKIEDLR